MSNGTSFNSATCDRLQSVTSTDNICMVCFSLQVEVQIHPRNVPGQERRARPHRRTRTNSHRLDGGTAGHSTRFSRSHRHCEPDLVAADRATGETQPAVQATHEVIERRQTVGRDVAAEAYQPGAYRDRVILHVDRDPG